MELNAQFSKSFSCDHTNKMPRYVCFNVLYRHGDDCATWLNSWIYYDFFFHHFVPSPFNVAPNNIIKDTRWIWKYEKETNSLASPKSVVTNLIIIPLNCIFLFFLFARNMQYFGDDLLKSILKFGDDFFFTFLLLQNSGLLSSEFHSKDISINQLEQ